MLTSSWDDTPSGDVEFQTTKINTPTVFETIPATTLTLLSPHDPQLDRFEDPKSGNEDIELKYVRGGAEPTLSLTGGLLDPPPTVTTEIRITTDGGGTFSFTGLPAGSYTVEISGFASDATFTATSTLSFVSRQR